MGKKRFIKILLCLSAGPPPSVRSGKFSLFFYCFLLFFMSAMDLELPYSFLIPVQPPKMHSSHLPVLSVHPVK